MNNCVCFKCNKLINANHHATQCNHCLAWFHMNCSGLNFKSAKTAVKIDWFCAPCLSSIFPFNHFDNDEEFLLALRESNSEFTFNIDPFKDLIFNPISETLTNINNLDSDEHFFNSCTSNNNNYLLEDTFVSEHSNKFDQFSLIHFNARSLPHNFYKFTNYLNLLQFPFSIIGVSETWLTSTNIAQCELDNYKLITCNRINRQGGGVALYIRDNIDFVELTDLGINDDNICQSLFIEFSINNRKVVTGIIYRPPNADVSLFNDYLDKTLNYLNKSNKLNYLMGDFNINLLNIEEN